MVTACLYGMISSSMPCTMKQGQVKLRILATLSQSEHPVDSSSPRFPAMSRATSWIEVNGEIATRPPASPELAAWNAGPGEEVSCPQACGHDTPVDALG
eukprot:767462-Hanusia_phi.AAC.2